MRGGVASAGAGAAGEQALPRPRCRPALLFPAGFAIAVAGAICGIGGGLFAVPLLHYAVGLPLRVAVGTSLYLVFATSAAATVTEALRPDSHIAWPLLGVLAVGAIAGTQLGYVVSPRIRARHLRLVFTVVLAVAGARMLGASDAGGPDLATGFQLDGRTLAAGLAIGFGGGFLAPLLGIGGGLLMVPALFMALPSLGYLGARAQSLAVAVLSSSRSMVLYARERSVHPACAAFLASGALLGAIVGVTLVHRPGWAGHARTAMGVLLCLVALRFFLDWRGGDRR